MDEREWLTCTDPEPLLQYLQGKASDRKLRLFAVACCWRRRDILTDAPSRAAVEAAERFADGLASRAELRRLGRPRNVGLYLGAYDAAYPDAAKAAREASASAAELASLIYPRRERPERRVQARLLRDIFGNPFRPATLDPAWLAWGGGTARKLAETIYDKRRFRNLPILADVLEEAGCTDAEILGHLRGPGPHVRGCFAVDTILGRS
jgi:hypothetical protein